MPNVSTRHFGVISCHEDAILEFPEGLPAFESARQFVVIEEASVSPGVFLQSLDDTQLCFVMLPVLAVCPGYQIEIPAEDLLTLGLAAEQPSIGSDVACFVIVSAAENCPPTANLLAPIVMNLAKRRGAQVIRLDTAYSHRHSLAQVPQCS
jgi:flagellar assembly factor FliW